IDVNATHGSDRSTALHVAAAVGFEAGLERLLSHPSLHSIDIRDSRGHTALHRAVLANQPACVRVLIRSGARVDLPNQDDRLPLQTAVRHRAIDCVHILLSPDLARPPMSGLLRDAVMGGSSAILKVLLGFSDATISSELINLAVFWNRIECLQVLLSRQNRPQLCLFDYDNSPLYTAVQHRKIDMVRLLRSHRANPCRPDGSNPSLIYAAAHGFLDMIPLLYTRSTTPATVREAILLSDAIGM
ncbi:ankyrin repeat-containing domain protein, partial [Syncephalastrum racemosum]